MSHHAFDTQAIGNDVMMDAARMWAPINPAPMAFEPGFVLERALTPQPVPLHVQRWMDDAYRAWSHFTAFTGVAISGLAILCVAVMIVAVYRGRRQRKPNEALYQCERAMEGS